ncbi:MAG: winged helix-turn-helix transcriptional regulator [Oxalobacteraceae bacterium]|nr:winged helix-turn-helix transcriptional regulator [Oxalobacteraceae bacterium]
MSAPPIPLDQLQASAVQASALLKALSNPTRLLLLCQIGQGEYCVGELETLTGIRQPTLSQQLTILRAEALVSTRREGKQIYYRIASTQALAVMQVLIEQFCQSENGATP